MDALLAFLSHDWAGLAIATTLAVTAWWARRASRGWVRRGAIGIGGIALLLGIGSTYHLLHMAQVHRTWPAPGKLVDVGGYRMHVLAEGSANGRASVLWMPGSHEAGYAFYHLHAALKTAARSILIDRPGSGWSEAGPFPRTTGLEAQEIITSLTKSGERGPFILVGHSFGGLLMANIARARPDFVAAVVLLDATPPDAINYAPPNPYLVGMRRSALLLTLTRVFGIHHDTLARLMGEEPDAEARRVGSILAQRLGPRLEIMESVDDASAVGVADYSIFRELTRGGLGWENSVYDGELGSVPVYLVAPVGIPGFDTLAHVMYVDGGGTALGPEAAYRERLRQFWDRTRERYQAISGNVERVYAPAGSSHNFPYEHPDFVLDVVRRVLTEHPRVSH